MAQVAHGEPELRRVIDEDRELDGVGEQELLDLYRSLIALRVYDERSVVYHRQGRIGTYAIYWGHEAIQAGSVFALEDEDWIFPSYRESAIGLLRRGHAAAYDPCCTGGAAIPPAGGTRRSTTSRRSACRSRRTCRMPQDSPGGRS